MEGLPQLIPILLTLALSTGTLAVESCAPSEDLVPGSSQPGVVAVVERRVVASNPLPWGRSVSMVTRLWGTATVERWVTSERGDDCADPRRSVGIATFRRVGGPEPALLVPEAGLVSDLEVAALTARFGEPIVSEPTPVDGVLAWLLVFPSVIVAAVALLTAIAVVVRRRRNRSPDGYLF